MWACSRAGRGSIQWAELVFFFAAGLYFGALYIARGFGIVAGVHACYDLAVLVVIPGQLADGLAFRIHRSGYTSPLWHLARPNRLWRSWRPIGGACSSERMRTKQTKAGLHLPDHRDSDADGPGGFDFGAGRRR